MTKLLEQAVLALQGLPEVEQDAFAQEILDRLEEEAEWERLVASEASQRWLAEEAVRVREDIEKGRVTPLDEQLLLDGLASGEPEETTEQYWEDRKAEAHDRIRQNR